MKTAEEIARKWFGATKDGDTARLLISQDLKEYARQCCEDVLNRAAENAEAASTVGVDKESITSTEIILP